MKRKHLPHLPFLGEITWWHSETQSWKETLIEIIPNDTGAIVVKIPTYAKFQIIEWSIKNLVTPNLSLYPKEAAGPISQRIFYLTIKIIWNHNPQLCHNLAHVATAGLAWHVQSSDIIWSLFPWLTTRSFTRVRLWVNKKHGFGVLMTHRLSNKILLFNKPISRPKDSSKI